MSQVSAAVLAATAVLLAGVALRGVAPAPRAVHPARTQRPALFQRPRPPDPEALADHLAALATEVRAGRSFTAARGAVPPPPWVHEARWTHHPHVALVRQMLDATSTLGGHVAPALDAAAAVLRQRAAVAADVAVHAAQARLSARVLTVVPVGFAAWGVVTDPRIRSAYVSSSVGPWLVLVGVGLNLGGWWWMHCLVRSIR